MKLIKFLVGIIAITLIPLCTIVMADDCFDTLIDDGKVYYIDPFDKYTFSKDKKILLNIYGDKIKCNGEKKTYTKEEYIDKISSDLHKDNQRQEKDSGGNAFIELIMFILGCVALRKIFVKAGKPGYYSLIPVYNFYEMSDMAGISGLFKKAVRCLIVGFLMIFISLHVMPIAQFPQIGMILICIFGIYMCAVNFYIARNFGWSTVASILYVLFNPIAVLILAFGNDKYCLTDPKEKMSEITRKSHSEDNSDLNLGESRESTMEGMDEDLNVNTGPKNNSQLEEDPIKYIDPDQFT